MASYRNVIYNFSFSRPRTLEDWLVWEDVSSVRESRLYCSEEAEKELKQHIAKYVVSGIHFIDSGDYHYMTKLITDQIREPFTLVLIDLCGEYTDEENVPLFLHAERVNLGCDRHLFEYLKTCLSVSKKKHLS